MRIDAYGRRMRRPYTPRGRRFSGSNGDSAITFAPFHPYTEALLSAVPSLTPGSESRRIVLEDTPTGSDGPHKGCPFAPRCTRKIGPVCENEPPPRRDFERAHYLTCHIPPHDLMDLALRVECR